MHTSRISLAEQLACAQRELRLRRAVYPRLVQHGKLKPAQAEQEIARMAAIVETLTALIAQREA